jgi:hypothetical protein
MESAAPHRSRWPNNPDLQSIGTVMPTVIMAFACAIAALTQTDNVDPAPAPKASHGAGVLGARELEIAVVQADENGGGASRFADVAPGVGQVEDVFFRHDQSLFHQARATTVPSRLSN